MLKPLIITSLVIVLLSSCSHTSKYKRKIASNAKTAIFENDDDCIELKNFPLFFCDGKDLGGNSIAAGQPRKWTEPEIKYIYNKTKKLLATGKLDMFFSRLSQTGFNKLYRYKYGFFIESSNSYLQSKQAMMVTHAGLGMMIISDRFLEYSLQDPISNFDRSDLSLLHELLHAFDGRDHLFSRNKEFLNLSGWSLSNNNYIFKGIFPENYKDKLAQFFSLLKNKDFDDAFLLSRQESIKVDQSSFAVFANPNEYFAETAATLFFDPKATNYISLDIQDWLYSNVLK